MKQLLRNFAFWILKIQRVNTLTQIEERISKLADGRGYTIAVYKDTLSQGIKYRYWLYIHPKIASGYKSDLEEAFRDLEYELDLYKDKKHNEVHI